nr:CHAT domain-containing protein [Acidobacteriota bacterium]
QLGKKRLLIASDGALQYIPFSALPIPTASEKKDTYQPLIVGHEIVTLPSASTLAVLRREVQNRQPAAKTLAVLADPVFESTDGRIKSLALKAPAVANFTDAGKSREIPFLLEKSAHESGLRESEFTLPRLPGTRDEAQHILSLVPAGQGKQALDFEASRETATNADMSQYRYVHFATHGFLNSLHPELSGIVLTMFDEKGTPRDGFLRLNDIFNLKLGADMVVLSACQTGLGKEIKGEGLVGLTRGFMYAGTPRVVVSLWSVSDEATAELMTRFYKGILVDKLRPAQALQAAQVSMLKDKRYSAPFYWAAFTLQGEWR